MKPIAIVLLGLMLASCSGRRQGDHPREVRERNTPAALIANAKQELSDAKAQLAQEGKYGCCIKEPCNMCALDEGDCDCYEGLKKGEHVCIECYAGWQQGKGADSRISKEKVHTGLLMHEHEPKEPPRDTPKDTIR